MRCQCQCQPFTVNFPIQAPWVPTPAPVVPAGPMTAGDIQLSPPINGIADLNTLLMQFSADIVTLQNRTGGP